MPDPDPRARFEQLYETLYKRVFAYAQRRVHDPERAREVTAEVFLVAWEGLTTREAARSLGCSVPTFSVRLHRARRRLSGQLTTTGTHRSATRPGTSTTAHPAAPDIVKEEVS